MVHLFDLDLIPVQGGSIRVYVSHINAKKVNSNNNWINGYFNDKIKIDIYQ